MSDNYSAMPDEQIDLLIAERVHGMELATKDAAAMLFLIDTMRKNGYSCTIHCRKNEGLQGATFYKDTQSWRYAVLGIWCPTLQRAVAIAALVALDAETVARNA